MKLRKILVYKFSGGALSLEKEGSIAITTIDEEQDSLELKGLGSLISDLEQNEYIGILISDDTDTPKPDVEKHIFEVHKGSIRAGELILIDKKDIGLSQEEILKKYKGFS